MPPMVDIFNSNAFQLQELAAAVEKIPYRPTRLRDLALFDEKPIATVALSIEERQGRLTLIGNTPRGAAGDVQGHARRKMRSFVAGHLRRTEKIMADEVQGVREFGSENAAQAIETIRNERLAILQAEHEVTWEFHRMGALTGSVLDADGSTVLLDLFTAFEVVQQTHDLALTDANLDVRKRVIAGERLIETELGGTVFPRVHALVGANYMDALIGHPSVKEALKYTEGRMLLSDLRKGFTIGNTTFEEYRSGVVNAAGVTIDFINTDQGYAFPVGAVAPGGPLFMGRFAPQPFASTVNRLNPPLVVHPVVDPADQYIELIGISCPVYICTRPRAVIKLTKS